MPFSQLIGQDSAVAMLKRLLAADRLPHALLFAGPEGVGKHFAAKLLTQALLCTNRGKGGGASLFGGAPAASKDDACGKCSACQRVLSGQHPDLHEVSGTGAMGFIQVEPVRELSRVLHLHSVEGGAKVAILDPADRMNKESANTLLKTLEEPPPETVLLLIARERSLLLPTIVSRCHVIRFGLLDREALSRYLATSGEDLGFREAPDLARLAVALAGGSIGKLLAHSAEDLRASRGSLRDAIGRLETAARQGSLKWAEGLAATGKESSGALEAILEGLTLFFRDVAAQKAGVPPEGLSNQDLLPEIGRWSARLSLPGAVSRLEAVLSARDALQANAHKEMALVALAERLSN
ncbi:MAG: DNA polymerase III subunit delta' [Bdellovibrionota bacterium]